MATTFDSATLSRLVKLGKDFVFNLSKFAVMRLKILLQKPILIVLWKLYEISFEHRLSIVLKPSDS